MDTTSQKRNQTIGYFGAFIGLGMATAALGPTLPYLAENTNSLIGEVSILFTTKAGGYLLGSLVGGRLYDRLNGHHLAFGAVLGVGIMLALSPVMSLLWFLSLVMFLLGMFEGALDVGCNALLVWVHGSKVGPYMNALHFFFGLGTFVAPIIAAQSVLRTGGIRWGYWTLAFLLLPVALWILRTSSPISPSSEEQDGGRKDTKLLVIIVAFLLIYVGAEIGFGGWIYTYALELKLATETTGAYLTSAYWGAFTVGRLISIPIAAKLRPRWILIVDLLGGILSLLMILMFSDSSIVLWMGTILLGLFIASIFPTVFSLAERRMTLTGSVTSWFFVGGSLGSMFFPWLMGQFIAFSGPQAMITLLLTILGLDFLILLGLLRYSHPKTVEA